MRATHPPGPKIGREASIRRRLSDRKATGHKKWRGRRRQPARIAPQRRSLLCAITDRAARNGGGWNNQKKRQDCGEKLAQQGCHCACILNTKVKNRTLHQKREGCGTQNRSTHQPVGHPPIHSMAYF